MNTRTCEYLEGRFGDHYRRVSVTPPPAANEREWGYIPWATEGTTMIRHNSFLDLTGGGTFDEFLATIRPRHMYYSAGYYQHPGAGSMGQKDWRGSDLIFDLDADHLPGVDPESDSFSEMLATCKQALTQLLDFLETDFGFEQISIVFSGNRGYHVHVRDPGIQELGRHARRHIVEYILGEDLEFSDIITTETVAGTAGRSSPAQKRSLPDGGWGRRTRQAVLSVLAEIRSMDNTAAVDYLCEFDGIGEGKAKAIQAAAADNATEIQQGNIDVHPAVISLAQQIFSEVRETQRAPIDEPVTTDINRLIRLPGSLHGGSGLAVFPIGRDELAGFDPLSDPIPDTFMRHEISIDVTAPLTVELNGQRFDLGEGKTTVPEYVGIFAMARDCAELA